MRVANGDVVAFVLAFMLLLCFGTDYAAAANDDDNNNDDQGLFVKQSMWIALHKHDSVGKNIDRKIEMLWSTKVAVMAKASHVVVVVFVTAVVLQALTEGKYQISVYYVVKEWHIYQFKLIFEKQKKSKHRPCFSDGNFIDTLQNGGLDCTSKCILELYCIPANWPIRMRPWYATFQC